MRAFIAAARHGGIAPQQNGKWLIFGKDSRGAQAKSRFQPAVGSDCFCALHA